MIKMESNKKDITIERFMRQFIKLKDKDVFEQHYKVFMAYRVLNYTFYDDIEKDVIQKIKDEWGWS